METGEEMGERERDGKGEKERLGRVREIHRQGEGRRGRERGRERRQ